MLKIDKLSYSFPQKDLYKEISFSLEEGQHCAFIGTNGTGKSTLIQMIRNPDEYMFEGKLEMSPDHRIGYVSQFSQMDQVAEMTVFDYISEPFVKQQEEVNRICAEMENAENMDDLLEQYQEAWDTFTAMDGDNYEVTIKKQLKLAGLERLENIDVQKISGGEFKLIQVIREMSTLPGLLIMDEPDVFLDFENLTALRELINDHKGTLLVITHNRYLLNHCFNKILHLENMEIQEFDGNYREYNFALLMKKIELQEQSVKEQEEIERNEKLVNHLRARATAVDNATRGKQLKARVSQLKRLQERQIKAPFVEIPHPEIYLHTTHVLDTLSGDEASSTNSEAENESPESRTILTVQDYSVSFDEQLLENVSFALGARDKVAIVGGNGTGKTTLLRDIVSHESNAITLEPEVELAYLSQQQGETLNEEQTILQTMDETGLETLAEAEAYLKPYGFSKEMMNQKISSLSGGEKNLLQLAILSRGDANLLLLDEPTSHLDTYAQESLEEAIAAYNGAVLMVSHDFYTIANCVDYVLYVDEKTVRRVSGRKFRKMIYANHFDRDYLEKEQTKKELEGRIYRALNKKDYESAKKISADLEQIVESM